MTVQSERDLSGLLRAGRVVAETLRDVERALAPGITTAELDAIAAATFARFGARSAPQLVYAAPSAIFVSVNDEAVHGLPGARALQPGDLVKVDVTAELEGYVADAAITVALPPVATSSARLRGCAVAAFARASGSVRAGRLLSDIGRNLEAETRRHGCTILRELSSHGVGRTVHEPPTILNYYDRRERRRLTEGLVITIEPIVSLGRDGVALDADGWTIRTADGARAAHHEHTLVVTRGAPIVVTAA